MRMVYGGLKKKSQLPDKCPNDPPMNSGLIQQCGISFAGGRNLFQDTDLLVYCKSCGRCLGQFEPNTVPFSLHNKQDDLVRKG